MRLDLQKRVFLFKMYYKTASIKAVQRAYQAEYHYETAPTAKVIKNIVSKFEKHGSVIGKHKTADLPAKNEKMAKISSKR